MRSVPKIVPAYRIVTSELVCVGGVDGSVSRAEKHYVGAGIISRIGYGRGIAVADGKRVDPVEHVVLPHVYGAGLAARTVVFGPLLPCVFQHGGISDAFPCADFVDYAVNPFLVLVGKRGVRYLD